MKTRYKYIYFEEVAPKADRWECNNKKTKKVMGVIEYWQGWGQYIIEFKEGYVFSIDCLNDIADFLGQLNKNKK